MITSSARLAATKAPLHSVATWTALTTNSLRTSPRALSACTHQRRHSSSKPSSPANGSKRVAQGVLPTEHSSTKSDSEKKSSRATKTEKDVLTPKKAKDAASLLPVSDVLKGRPAPSTNTAQATSNKSHLPRVQNGGSSLQDIRTAAFFAIDRPIAPASAFPIHVTDPQFRSLFEAPPKASETAMAVTDIIETVKRLNLEKESNLDNSSHESSWMPGGVAGFRAALADTSFPSSVSSPPQHLDGAPRIVSHPSPMQLFQAPPSALNNGTNASPITRVHEYKIDVTYKEYHHANGEISSEYHAQPASPPPQTPHLYNALDQPSDRLYVPSPHRQIVLRRRQASEMRFATQGRQALDSLTYEALSVKRIRKAKMKKKKYKKLMRKNRTLRRKLERG